MIHVILGLLFPFMVHTFTQYGIIALANPRRRRSFCCPWFVMDSQTLLSEIGVYSIKFIPSPIPCLPSSCFFESRIVIWHNSLQLHRPMFQKYMYAENWSVMFIQIKTAKYVGRSVLVVLYNIVHKCSLLTGYRHSPKFCILVHANNAYLLYNCPFTQFLCNS